MSINTRLFRRSRARAAARSLAAIVLAGASGHAIGAGLEAQAPHALSALAGLHTPDADKLAHALAEQRGKAVVLHFWGTWCEPCREEIPALARFAQAHAGTPLAIITVAVNDKPEAVDAFLAEAGAPLPVLRDRDQSLSRALSITVLPSTLVLDTRHRVRYRSVGALDWNAAAVRGAIGALVPRSTTAQSRPPPVR